MYPDADDAFQEHLRQFQRRNAAHEEIFRQAAAYVAARRIVQDLEALNKPHIPLWRRVHPSRLVGGVQSWLHRSPRETAPVIIDGEVISRSYGSSAASERADQADSPPIVIIIPPFTDGHQ